MDTIKISKSFHNFLEHKEQEFVKVLHSHGFLFSAVTNRSRSENYKTLQPKGQSTLTLL